MPLRFLLPSAVSVFLTLFLLCSPTLAAELTRAQVSDLGSTNGTTLNGRALRTALLEPDSIIDIGATRIVYRVLAQSKERRA